MAKEEKKSLTEGFIKKGGVNKPPQTAKPNNPPKPQTSNSKSSSSSEKK